MSKITINQLPEQQIGALLHENGWTVSTAESCTGGLIGHKVTQVSGSSEYYLGGIIAYSNQVKEQMLGVNPATLVAYGAVSAETVLEMAIGARVRFGTDLAVSVSGIAGPGGGVPGKPVGTVWIGICTETDTWSKVFHFDGSRKQVKESAAKEALSALVKLLIDGHPW